MNPKAQILDSPSMQRSITRMSHEILERNKGLDNVTLVGILTRGVTLAERIAVKLAEIEGITPDVQSLDARPYRDDVAHRESLDLVTPNLVKRGSEGLRVQGKTVVLVDDVLYTGRTVRAALDAIMTSGRAKNVQLAALIDRGHRELPIRPDFVGKNVPSGKEEEILVRFQEVDGEDGVWIYGCLPAESSVSQ